jgi:hypothetical protein
MMKKKQIKTKLFVALLTFLLVAFTAPVSATNYYVDATNGNDSNDGTSPAAAWQTLSKVSGSSFNPGDSILLKRGEIYRGQIIIPNSGTETTPITFSAYGTGDKPLILGSIDYTDEANWSSLGNNLWTTAEGSFPSDIGFILFGEESNDNTGFKYIDHKKDQVTKEKDFWYDREKKCIVVYSTGNPGQVYPSIEIGYNIAVHSHVIQGRVSGISYIHVENLEIKYFNSHAMAFVDAVGIEVRDCDISWGGGSGRYYYEDDEWNMSRFGNGIEFWKSSKDCIVERCRVGQCFDSGLTFQGGSNVCDVSNIIFRDNIVFCNDMGNFEIGFGNDNTIIKNIYYENNISIGAGRGWSREQRLHKTFGWDLTTWYGHTKEFDGFNVNNNVFYNPWGISIFNLFKSGITNQVMDYNYYYKPEVPSYDDRSYLLWLYDESESDKLAIYKTHTFEDYKSKTGLDKNSKCNYDRTVAQKASRKKMPKLVYYINSLFEEVEEVVSGNLPERFNLTSPADGSLVNGEVTLSWEASSATYSTLDHYEVWIDCEHVANVPVEETTYKTMLTNAEHSWFVVAVCEDSSYWRQSSTNPKFTVVEGMSVYTLTVNSGTGSGNYLEKDTIDISPDILRGKKFIEWTGDTEYLTSSVTTADNEVAMPAGEVSLTAVYGETNTTSNNSIVENSSFFAYPNPVNSKLTISTTNEFVGKVEVKVYNQIGEEVYRSINEVTFPYQVDVSSFASGIYLIKVSDENNQEILKIIKN